MTRQGVRQRTPVVVIDDDGDVSELLATMFAASDDFELVAVTAEVDSGVDLVERHRPDAVVLDLEAVDVDVSAVIARLRSVSPSSSIVVLTAFPDPVTLLDVLTHGADHYLDKARAWADLLPSLQVLRSG